MKTTLVLGFAVWIAGCGGGGGGDDTGETPDAPTTIDSRPGTPDARTPDAASLTCNPASPDDCTGETICVGDQCEDAFNRIYDFSSISATVATLNQGGSAWDSFGGAPDPYVEVRLNGATLLTTSVTSDVFFASFTETTDEIIVAGSTLELLVRDSDIDGDDPITSCTIDPLTAAHLREIILFCDGIGTEAGSSVTLYIDVRG